MKPLLFGLGFLAFIALAMGSYVAWVWFIAHSVKQAQAWGML